MFGFVAYATYDLTNLATLKGWTTKLCYRGFALGRSADGRCCRAKFLVLAPWLICIGSLLHGTRRGLWLVGFLTALAFQTIMFVIATRLRRDDLVDVGGDCRLSFLFGRGGRWDSHGHGNPNLWFGTLVAFMVTVWGSRLSLHILMRF